MFVCLCVCMFFCLCVYVFMCFYVYMFICLHVYVFMCLWFSVIFRGVHFLSFPRLCIFHSGIFQVVHFPFWQSLGRAISIDPSKLTNEEESEDKVKYRQAKDEADCVLNLAEDKLVDKVELPLPKP